MIAFLTVHEAMLNALPEEADPEDVVFESLVSAGNVVKALKLLLADELMLHSNESAFDAVKSLMDDTPAAGFIESTMTAAVGGIRNCQHNYTLLANPSRS